MLEIVAKGFRTAKNALTGKTELSEAVTTFYSMMGWDPKTGRPLDVTLDELDVSWAKGIV